MLGKLIKIFRQERGLGVQEFAKNLGINRISLFRIEKGQRRASEQTAVKALKFLELAEENIYQIFIFNELLKLGAISEKAKNKEARLFLKRLNKSDKDSKIIHRYFQNRLKMKKYG